VTIRTHSGSERLSECNVRGSSKSFAKPTTILYFAGHYKLHPITLGGVDSLPLCDRHTCRYGYVGDPRDVLCAGTSFISLTAASSVCGILRVGTFSLSDRLRDDRP